MVSNMPFSRQKRLRDRVVEEPAKCCSGNQFLATETEVGNILNKVLLDRLPANLRKLLAAMGRKSRVSMPHSGFWALVAAKKKRQSTRLPTGSNFQRLGHSPNVFFFQLIFHQECFPFLAQSSVIFRDSMQTQSSYWNLQKSSQFIPSNQSNNLTKLCLHM